MSNYTTENRRLGFSPYLQLKSWYFISNYCSFKLSAPITIIHYPGPGWRASIKRSYYFKPISNMIYKTVMQPPQVITL